MNAIAMTITHYGVIRMTGIPASVATLIGRVFYARVPGARVG